jgi:hypothetical protein
MRVAWSQTAGLAAGVLAVVGLAACTGEHGAAGPGQPSSFRWASFHPSDFARPLPPRNRWLPLRPGYQWVRAGTTDVGHRPVPHRVVSTVTALTKLIDGVRTLAVLDQDIDAGQISQESLDYFAQDRRGDVWYLGSYTEEYEGGLFTSATDAWLSGVQGARPGILMPARPNPQLPAWSIAQPPGADPDAAQAVFTSRSQCVPFRCFRHVLVVREGKASAIDNEFKFYAPGVGQILNTPRSMSMHHDFEQLINMIRLSRRGLAEMNAEALRLDRHARVTSPRTFGHSRPAVVPR